MTLDEFRHGMKAFYDRALAESVEMKDPFVVQEQLDGLYRSFDAAERAMANQVLSEWLASNDRQLRSYAQAIVGIFQVASAIPALESLYQRLENDVSPMGRDEREMIPEMIAELRSAKDGQRPI